MGGEEAAPGEAKVTGAQDGQGSGRVHGHKAQSKEELLSETRLKDGQRTKVKWESRVQDVEAEQRVCERGGQRLGGASQREAPR